MALEVGTRLGAYEITGPLGAGGMGEVYRAKDVKLGREVAIKTLPAALAGDADRLARFDREAKLLAALNHAHIAAIYGLDEHEGTRYLAMELVEGQTLEEKLEAGALPVEDALNLALQIAEALEAAHAKGVVHRDLKPANVMITPDGAVKVLDFGLAKAFSSEPGNGSPDDSPALSLAMTQSGIMLGTAGYMSPEQASGQPTDKRADIWAFGVVLYEMLTGLPLFSGESVPHVLADVLKSEPDWSRLPKNLNPRVKRLLERCLRKKARNRYHSIADVRIDIEDALRDPDGVTVAAVGMRPARPRALPVAVAVVATAALAAMIAWLAWPASESKYVTRVPYAIPEDQTLATTQTAVMALSPDGRSFVYQTTQGLYRHELAKLGAELLPGTNGAFEPFFSPNGKSIAYWAQREFGMRRIGIDGGASAPILRLGELRPPLRASWGTDGAIYYAQLGGDGIYRVPAAGGEAELIIPAADGEILSGPSLLPDGDTLLFTSSPNEQDTTAQIVVESLTTRQRTTLITGGSNARYVPTGHIVYVSGDTLFGKAFDLETLTVSGAAQPLVSGIARGTGNGDADYDIADNGTLAYLTGDIAGMARTIVSVDRSDHEEPLLNLTPRNYRYVEISPDGRRLAFEAADDDHDIWIYELDSGNLRKLTVDSGVNRGGVWAGNDRVVFTRQTDHDTDEIDWQAVNGAGAPEALLGDSGMLIAPTDVAPDGSALLYSQAPPPRDVFMLAIGQPDAKPVPLIGGADTQFNGQVSPDGKWLAFQTFGSSQTGVYVAPFPDVESGLRQIASNATHPRWSRNELFYYVDQPDGQVALMAVPYQSEPDLSFGAAHELFRGDYVRGGDGVATYDVTPDGQKFVMIKAAPGGESGSPPQIIVVENWFEELKQKVPAE